MENLILHFLFTDDAGERRRLILSYPILLSDVATHITSRMTDRLGDLNQPGFANINSGLALLSDCRSRGVEAIFPDAFRSDMFSLPRPADREMVLIPDGEFTAGNTEVGQEDDLPARTVFLDAFRIDKYPVTNAEYARFILESGYPLDEKRMNVEISGPADSAADDSVLAQLQALLADETSRGFKLGLARTHPDHPVAEISWYDAVEYARWVNKRLPTADEWEKAARGTDRRKWSWGNDRDVSKGNTRESELEETTPVFAYAAWPSPYGCCDMSGNVTEWTLTPVGSDSPDNDGYVIKGGCWMFSIDEAQVWKQHDDPPGDLWNALGFRCCSSTPEKGPESIREDYERDYDTRMMRSVFNIDLDSRAMIAVATIARKVAAGESTLEEAKTLLDATLREPELPADIAREVADHICQTVLLNTLGSFTDMPTAAVLNVIAELGTHLADQIGDPELIAHADYALGMAQLNGHNPSDAAQIFESCLKYYREQSQDQRQLATTLFALATAEAHRNLTFGDEAIGATSARGHLEEVLPLLRKLGMSAEEQRATCALANVHRLLGETQKAFETAQLALGKTIYLTDTREEIRGILAVGNAFLDIYAFDHAVYCFKTAHRRASAIGDTKLVIEARLNRFLALTLLDKEQAARSGAETLEAITFFESGFLQQALNVVYNQGHDKIRSWVIGSLLGHIVAATQNEDFTLPLLPLAQGAVAYAFKVPALLSETAATLEAWLSRELTSAEECFTRTLLALAYIKNQPDLAKGEILAAVEAARLTESATLLVNAQQLEVEIFRELGCWQEAISVIKDIRPRILQLGNDELSVAYLAYEARMYFWSGDVTAALEACDFATIEAHEKLDAFTSARNTADQHLLRSEILSAIGSDKALIEAEATKLLFFSAGDRLGSARYMLRMAQVILDPVFDKTMLYRKAVENIQYAGNIISGNTRGQRDERLTCELLHTTGLLYLRFQRSAEASDYLVRALEMAEAIDYEDMQMKALEDLISLKLDGNSSDEVEELSQNLITLVRRRRRPFELISALGLTGRYYADTGHTDKAREAFQEATTHYESVRRTIKNNPILRKGWLRKNLNLFEDFITRGLVPANKKQEALLILQRVKAASLGDLLAESRLVTAHGLPSEKAAQAKSLWREIRQREVSLEQSAGWVGNEFEEYRTRVELRTLRHDLQALWGEEWAQEVNVFTAEDLKQLWELLPARPVTTILELFVTSKCVLAFILSPDNEVHAVIQLDHLNRQQLEAQVTEFFTEPYKAFTEALTGAHDEDIAEKRGELFSGLKTLLWDLYTALFSTAGRDGRSVGQTLKELTTEKLIIVPSGMLSSLPLHGLFIGSGNASQYLLDEVESVSFAPSLSTLKRCLTQGSRTPNTLVAIQNPDETLRHGDLEVRVVKTLFPGTIVLAHDQATKRRVTEELAKAELTHFTCHGFFASSFPLDSGLVLADASLSLADIYLNVVLRPGAVVTLAACESGMVDPAFTDEFLGFPSGFIYAGASGVVSSFWMVDDLSTTLLMERFYLNHQGGMTLAAALKEAQVWLRGLTAAGLTERFNDERRKPAEQRIMSYDDASSAWQRFAAMHTTTRPFENPFYWAAFSVSGV
jgi:formylglycine-generating enzyme required for sulfatase activity/CHAT domain-containing protein/tetratricopeptide (TPR) repeat protein